MQDPVSRTFSRRLLVAAVSPDPRTFARLIETDANLIDWDWTLSRAARHKVAALLAFRLHEADAFARLPTDVQARLQIIRTNARHQTARARRTLQQVAARLDAIGLPFLVLKGSTLAERAYDDPEMRPFFDVDLVVREEQLGRAEQALTSLGYRFYSGTVTTLAWEGVRIEGTGDAPVPDEIARAVYRRVHHHFIFAPSDSGMVPVELHWRLVRPSLMTLEPSALWTHVQSATVAGIPVLILEPEAMLVHAAVHAMSEGAQDFRLLRLVDLAWLLERPGGHDADRVWTLAKDWGVRGDVACALQMLHDLVGIDPTRLFDYQRRQGAIRRSIFRIVGSPSARLDRHERSGGLGGLWTSLISELVWELSARRLPRYTMRVAAMGLRGGWRRVGGGDSNGDTGRA